MNEVNDKKYIVNQWILSGLLMAVAFAALVGLKYGNVERNEINFEFFMKALIPSLVLFPILGYFVGLNEWGSILKKRGSQLPLLKKQLDEKKIIKFELVKSSMNFYKNFHKWALLVIVIIYIVLFISIPKPNHDLTNAVQGASFLCGAMYVLVLLNVFKIWRARMACELTFDSENKEFNAFIIDRKDVIIFTVNDIKEVGKEPRQGGFRFYLNDGSWVTWDSAFTNKEEDLENLVRSLGVSIRIQAFW